MSGKSSGSMLNPLVTAEIVEGFDGSNAGSAGEKVALIGAAFTNVDFIFIADLSGSENGLLDPAAEVFQKLKQMSITHRKREPL